MVDESHEHPPAGLTQQQAPPRRSRWRLGLLLALALVGGVGVLVALWLSRRPAEVPLDGKLVVVVRPPGRAQKARGVEEPGALPVRAGGQMSLEVHFNQPAFAYLVWLDSQAQTIPLYPWNHDRIEAKDANEPPPRRKSTTVVFNPPLGVGWQFGEQGGLETVLLLARRTPLDEGTRLGPLLGPLPPTRVRLRDEVAILGLGAGDDAVSTLLAQNRGSEAEARAADEPLRALLLGLREHFELIRAVRFAHDGTEK